MITIKENDPRGLWEELAIRVLSDKHKITWDLSLGKRKISYMNDFNIHSWPGSFTAEGLYWAVGYELHGNKMTHLFNSYVDQDKWAQFKQAYEAKKKNSHYSIGMNFKREPAGKGGCLSSFEIVGDRKRQFLVVHSKTAEFPKKFTADMRMVGWLINDLGLKSVRVYWSIAVIWYTEQFLKGIKTVLGEAYFCTLVGDKRMKELSRFMPGYVEPTQQRIKKHFDSLHSFTQSSGLKMDEKTGRILKHGQSK